MKKILLGLLLGSFTLQAAENLQFNGTLIAPPICTVNNQETLEIDFSNVWIDKIDGNNYKKPVGLSVECDYDNQDNAIQMTLTFGGSPSSFNPAAIATDIKGLGIAIAQNGVPLTIGKALVVNEQNMPLLEAVPVKESGASLKENAFEAWATIKVEYQ